LLRRNKKKGSINPTWRRGEIGKCGGELVSESRKMLYSIFRRGGKHLTRLSGEIKGPFPMKKLLRGGTKKKSPQRKGTSSLQSCDGILPRGLQERRRASHTGGKKSPAKFTSWEKRGNSISGVKKIKKGGIFRQKKRKNLLTIGVKIFFN